MSDARRVVVATRNRGKLREILRLLADAGVTMDLVTIDEIAPDAVLPEEEPTFEGNALSKARAAATATGLPAIADDSGLEVDALDGAPGVWSARYAGEPSDDARNNAKLISAMGGVTPDRRRGRFRCVAAYVDRDRGLELTRAGVVEGEILSAPRGDKGFGYDPLFLLPDKDRTLAELDLDEKNQVSHRAAAFKALADALAQTGA